MNAYFFLVKSITINKAGSCVIVAETASEAYEKAVTNFEKQFGGVPFYIERMNKV